MRRRRRSKRSPFDGRCAAGAAPSMLASQWPCSPSVGRSRSIGRQPWPCSRLRCWQPVQPMAGAATGSRCAAAWPVGRFRYPVAPLAQTLLRERSRRLVRDAGSQWPWPVGRCSPRLAGALRCWQPMAGARCSPSVGRCASMLAVPSVHGRCSHWQPWPVAVRSPSVGRSRSIGRQPWPCSRLRCWRPVAVAGWPVRASMAGAAVAGCGAQPLGWPFAFDWTPTVAVQPPSMLAAGAADGRCAVQPLGWPVRFDAGSTECAWPVQPLAAVAGAVQPLGSRSIGRQPWPCSRLRCWQPVRCAAPRLAGALRCWQPWPVRSPSMAGAAGSMLAAGAQPLGRLAVFGIPWHR